MNESTGIVEKLRALAEAQIEDNLDYIRRADELMLEAADLIASLPQPVQAAGLVPDGWVCEDEFSLEPESYDDWIERGLEPQPFVFIRSQAAQSPGVLPAVKVKALEWEHLGGSFWRAKMPLFGWVRIEDYGSKFSVAWSVPGFCNTFTPGKFDTVEEAKAAAEADYQRRILSALSPLPASQPEVEKLRAALTALINDVQEWVDAVERGTSWDYWDHHYKHLAYGGLDQYRATLNREVPHAE